MYTPNKLVIVGCVLFGCSEYKLTDSEDPVPPEVVDLIAEIEVAPTAIDFGILEVGTPESVSVEITNIGNDTLALEEVVLYDATGSFSTTNIGSGFLEPEEVTNFVVTYQPVDFESHNAYIEVGSSDPVTPVVEVSLMGGALTPDITIEPQIHDFGVVDGPVDLSVVVSNVGDVGLNVYAIDYITSSQSELYLADAGLFMHGAAVLGVGESTEMWVRFHPTDASYEEGSLHVYSDDPDTPDAVASQHGMGIPVPTCECPEGFLPYEDESSCYQEIETPAIPTGEVVEVCAIEPYFAYGKFGAKYPEGTSFQDEYWGQDDYVPNGRLNASGVWGCDSPGSTTAGSQPVGSWIGFSVCVDVENDGDYLLGLGGDNRVRFAVDGTMVLEQTGDNTSNFNYWWLNAIPLEAGTHIINVEGYNAGSIAAFGAELAGPFPADSFVDDASMAAADYANNIIWATNDAIGDAFSIGEGIGWVCPDGTVFEGCEEPVCVSIEEVPCE